VTTIPGTGPGATPTVPVTPAPKPAPSAAPDFPEDPGAEPDQGGAQEVLAELDALYRENPEAYHAAIAVFMARAVAQGRADARKPRVNPFIDPDYARRVEAAAAEPTEPKPAAPTASTSERVMGWVARRGRLGKVLLFLGLTLACSVLVALPIFLGLALGIVSTSFRLGFSFGSK
jgi:hypothetical protein